MTSAAPIETAVQSHRNGLAFVFLAGVLWSTVGLGIRLIEHAVVGAAPVYSASWREARRASVHNAALCLPNDQNVWYGAVSQLIADRDEMQRIAEVAEDQELFIRLLDPEIGTHSWSLVVVAVLMLVWYSVSVL